MLNRGEEKVRVHMNVVPRSTSATRHNIHMSYIGITTVFVDTRLSKTQASLIFFVAAGR